MKNYTRILTILFLALLTFVMSATAQTNDNKNKAIVETTDGTQQLNTDEISIIRFLFYFNIITERIRHMHNFYSTFPVIWKRMFFIY